MKLFVLGCTFLLVSANVSAQNKNCNLKIITDKLSNSKTAYTPEILFTNGPVHINQKFFRSGNSIVFSAALEGLDLFCVDNASTVVFSFTDQSSVILKSTNTGNCLGNIMAVISMQSSTEDMNAILNKTIDTIKIIGKGQAADFKTSAADAKKLKQYFTCIKDLTL